jgi:hypothetical protein
MQDWGSALDGFAVETIAPSAVSDDVGHATPADALAAAGGPPATAPDTPLLVAVNDPDRATRSAPALAALRNACGSRPMRIVVATGTHAFPEEVRRRHQAGLLDGAGEPSEIHWHDASAGTLAALGALRVNPLLAEARDVVAVGGAEPHWFAGLSGAHKTLGIGLLSRDGVVANHERALDPEVRPLVLAGNPVHDGIAAVVEEMQRGRAVLALQHLGRRWFAGPPLTSAEDCLGAARARWVRHVDPALDFLVACVDPPLDRTLYQAEKGIKLNEYAVRDGGAIVLDAACPDGVGPPRFVELLGHAPDVEAARHAIRTEGYRLGDHKAVRLRALQDRGVRLGVVAPGFPPDAAREARIDVLADAASAAAWLRERVGAGARGAVVEDAGHSVVETA